VRDACAACDATELRTLLSRSRVPVHQNRLAATAEEALRAPRGDLELACCVRCGLVFNRAFRPELLCYAPGYENDQTASPLFSAHVEERVHAMVREGVRNQQVIEIGCGNGEFLRRLTREGANRGVGFDPVAPSAVPWDGGAVRFEPRAFAGETLDPPPDVVVGRHVIEHVADPPALLELARRALGDDPGRRLYLETPGVEWMLETLAIWDFFYEHASYFGARSLANVLAVAGFRPLSLERVFGDQYLWTRAAPSAPQRPEPPPAEYFAALDSFVGREAGEISRWRDDVEAWGADGEVAVWGAGGKGATFLNLIDADRRRVSVVVDVHPLKQGRFIGGTGHPVVAPDRRHLGRVAHVVVMNPNYVAEVTSRIDELGLRATVHVAKPVD
jgi:SAM-dependent methyltransferase